MSDFNIAIKLVLMHEGGYVNNPADLGQATNFGVSLRFLADHPHEGDFDGDGDVDAEDIKNMSVEDAMKIYKQFWWDKYNYSNIPDQTISSKVLDLSINMGAPRSHKLLQQALNNAFGLKLTIDGVLGPATYSILSHIADGNDEQKLITAYCDAAWVFYQELIVNNPKLVVFKNGWHARAYSISVANSIS